MHVASAVSRHLTVSPAATTATITTTAATAARGMAKLKLRGRHRAAKGDRGEDHVGARHEQTHQRASVHGRSCRRCLVRCVLCRHGRCCSLALFLLAPPPQMLLPPLPSHTPLRMLVVVAIHGSVGAILIPIETFVVVAVFVKLLVEIAVAFTERLGPFIFVAAAASSSCSAAVSFELVAEFGHGQRLPVNREGRPHCRHVPGRTFHRGRRRLRVPCLVGGGRGGLVVAVHQHANQRRRPKHCSARLQARRRRLRWWRWGGSRRFPGTTSAAARRHAVHTRRQHRRGRHGAARIHLAPDCQGAV
mmetsp:Transcript_14952/g.27576  ORF Transcript_14952/g.27576 Transcript_14952/m.27576 type:complete len:304 (-) Transcript_14952:143-1054(-)